MKYYKYCASGNDFVLFQAEQRANRSKLAQELCNRHSGIGADGLIVILEHQNLDFEWEFYNCDGSLPLMCGNGSRAAAHFAHHILKKACKLSFLTAAGIIEAEVVKDEVEVLLTQKPLTKTSFEFEGKIWQECNTGVPHLVHFCEDINDFNLKTCQELRLKYNANVNYAQILDKNHIKVRTFERGVEAETLACGTGMAACFYLGVLHRGLENKLEVFPKSNESVYLRLEDEKIYFKGKVRCCFEANFFPL